METTSDPAEDFSLTLETFEFADAPMFSIRIGLIALSFDLLYTNEAFRNGSFRDTILADDREACLFRSWAQALGQPVNSERKFAGCIWTAKLAPGNARLKVFRATQYRTIECNVEQIAKTESNESLDSVASPDSDRWRTRLEYMNNTVGDRPGLFPNLPHTNLAARWEGIQTMLEMSDVGVFEYSLEGKLMYANEAYYKLSSYPRNISSDEQFVFMHLIHKEDRPMVMRMWNTLVQGYPVSFEMRWTPQGNSSSNGGMWVLASCVPIFDDEKTPTSIAGNVIDIDGQKRSQETTQARIEALEQARLSELKFARFARVSPTALFIFVPETGMQYVNDQFYELTGLTRAPNDQFEWFDIIADEDLKKVEQDWSSVLHGRRSDGFQFRLKKTWIDQDGEKEKIWVQSSSHPQLDEHGAVSSIMGTLFDISQFKWAERVQRRRIDEALEAKRQQENFIDMTSHELRNPLSAVLQCAESAIATLETLQKLHPPTDPITVMSNSFDEDIASAIDSIQTIMTCSLHQKRVIDDVLTLSKLDSELILVTPIKVQPIIVVLEALKMFDVECRQLGIELEFHVDDSAREFEWVMLDSSRLLQVLINLLTNAIKFTKNNCGQKITVEFGGSWIRPPDVWEDFSFRTDDQMRVNILEEPGWGNGTKAYLWIKVRDTGCGMSDEEQKKLFSRFTQATPRTHVTYGGSGLGLFISKTLASLQGGAIGVSSVKDSGSIFMFFISTRVTDSPEKYEAGHGPQVRPIPFQRAISSEAAMKEVDVKVLIVEDNVVNQKVLKKQLTKCGWTVYVAGDGEEALQWLQKSAHWRGDREKSSTEACDTNNSQEESADPDVDVILLDIFMPVMDGLTCVRRIREWEDEGLLGAPQPRPKSQRSCSTNSVSPIVSRPNEVPSVQASKFQIPVLAVSANARMEQIQESFRAGMNDAITKPFRLPELWPKIQSLVPRLSKPEVGRS
ncbi:hypothetical protein ACEQ8H_008689 [Pleosporales sp. CAS-2024a]